MGSGSITTTTHADAIKTLYSRNVIKEFEKNLQLRGLILDVTQWFDDKGSKLEIPIINDFSASDVGTIPETKQAVYDPKTVTYATNSITVDQHKYFSMEVTDTLKKLSYLKLAELYMPKLGYALAKIVDAAIAAYYSSTGDTAITVGTVSDLSSVTDAVLKGYLKDAKDDMDNRDVPREDRRWVFCPELYSRVGAMPEFASLDYSMQQFWPTGALGMLLGSPVYVSTNLTTDSGTGTNYKHNLYFHKNAIMGAFPFDIQLKFAPADGRYVHDQWTATIDYGLASNPNDGTTNYAIRDLKTTA